MEQFLSGYKVVTFTAEMIEFVNEFIFSVENLRSKLRQFDFTKTIEKKTLFGGTKTKSVEMTNEERVAWMTQQEPSAWVRNQFFHWDGSYHMYASYDKITRLRNLMNTNGSDSTAFLDDESYELFLGILRRMKAVGADVTTLADMLFRIGWRINDLPDEYNWVAMNDTYGQYKAVYAYHLEPEYRGGHGCHFKNPNDPIEPKLISRLERRVSDFRSATSRMKYSQYEESILNGK